MKKTSSKLEKNVESLIETVGFIKENMATKDELKDGLDNLEQRLGQRINSISTRLDNELDKRKQIEVRLTRVENKVR